MNQTAVKQVDTTTPAGRDERTLLPPVDVVEDATGITLVADLPGVSRERLHLHVEGDTLSIEGELSLAVPQDMQAGHVEVQAPRYRRSYPRLRI
jgi:HSP20 family protein